MHNQPLNLSSSTRRRLLKALTAAGFVGAVERQIAVAQTAPDYKALLTVFLQGGNDGDNTVIRTDNSGYQDYAKVRTVASGINIPQSSLLGIQPSNLATPLGLNPNLPLFKKLFDDKKLAIVGNMGNMIRPNSRAGLLAGTEIQPANLFSHTDQELQAQSADANGFTRTGWGGRLADKIETIYPNNPFPALTSINGLKTFTGGNTSVALALPSGPYFELYWAGQSDLTIARDAALNEILLKSNTDNVYNLTVKLLAEEGLAASSVVKPILQNKASVVTPLFANISSEIGKQLNIIALMLEGRAQTKLKRQVFYANHGGYDTHGSQATVQTRLLSELNQGLDAFDKALSVLGLQSSVTTLVFSEFGRTLKPSASQGTEHAWGSYGFAFGGAVKGGQLYGKLPTLALNGPDDFGTEGRWVPTTSMEQYAAPVLTWLGISEQDLPYILPNLGAFARNTVNYL
jgi:uncharacterized protein (DUF1501 family)